MRGASRSAPTEPAPKTRSLAALARAARTCRACPLYARATQTVFGEGPARAAIVLVGEQPGDVEDREGHPFVGPAGAVLDRAIEKAGLHRDRLYLTNAVKHFSWQPAAGASGERGKRRIHKKPRASEVKACRPWLDAELAHLEPRVIVCMGAVAVQSVLGSNAPIGASRGRTFETALGPAIVTRHPSSVLRQLDKASRQAALDELVADLRRAARLIARR
jgi:uracil-DNA glycosylase family protein